MGRRCLAGPEQLFGRFRLAGLGLLGDVARSGRRDQRISAAPVPSRTATTLPRSDRPTRCGNSQRLPGARFARRCTDALGWAPAVIPGDRDPMRRTLLAAALVIGATAAPAQAPRPVIDVHIHYSHDTWSGLPPPEAIKVLRQAGLRKAFVSSSSDDGTQMLLKAAPDLIVPVLRPYRRRGEIGLLDEGPEHHRPRREPAQGQHLRRHRRVPRLRRRRRHARDAAHGAARPRAQDLPARPLRRRRRRAHLQAEPRGAGAVGALGLRAGRQGARHGRRSTRRCGPTSPSAATRRRPASSTPRGSKLFVDFPDRFMVGTDTYTPERWHYVVEHAAYSRKWLAELPADLADNIAFRNAEQLAARTMPGWLAVSARHAWQQTASSRSSSPSPLWGGDRGGGHRRTGAESAVRASRSCSRSSILGAGGAAACEVPEGFARLASPQAEIAYRWEPAELKVGRFFAAEVIACRAPDAEPVRDHRPRRADAGSRPRHELSPGCRRDGPGPFPPHGADAAHARHLAADVRPLPGRQAHAADAATSP